MYFEQFYLSCLAHASYMIGSQGVAAVIDPQRDVEIYLDEARKNDLTILHVIETHLHADFVSGHQELAARTGAAIHLGAAAGARFDHVPVREGNEVRFGRSVLRFLETPGHTLESISVLVTDLDRSPEPFAVLTGDTLFIGDVGRPDLSGDHTPQQLAGKLYESLQKLLKLPDGVEVYPAHGAGSLCGRQMSTERLSTIGRERASNYALKAGSRDEFVRLLTAELPERPGYFALDVEINRSGAAPLADLPPIPALPAMEVLARREAGAVILDTRPAAQFGAAHIPGSLQIGLAGQYAVWAGTLLGLDTRVVLLAEDAEGVAESRIRLARVGIEGALGYVDGGIAGWAAAGMEVAQVPQIPVQDLHEHIAHLQVVDVRRKPEFQEGHIAGAFLKPLNHLREGLGDLDPERPVAVYCKSGYRSSIASSIVKAAGFPEVLNTVGGLDAWRSCGLPYLTGVARGA